MNETDINPAEVAAEILGYCKEGRNPAGESCTRHMSVGWPCERADAATEAIRAALVQAWYEGFNAGYDDQRNRDTGVPMPANPYAKEGQP